MQKKQGAGGDYLEKIEQSLGDVKKLRMESISNKLLHTEIIYLNATQPEFLKEPCEDELEFKLKSFRLLKEENMNLLKSITKMPIRVIDVNTTHNELIQHTDLIRAVLLSS